MFENLTFAIKKKRDHAMRCFISYKRLDNEDYAKKVSTLRVILSEFCTDVFFDEDELFVGDHLPDELRNGISSADFFVAIITPEYSLSEWCVMEYNYAITTLKRVIPIAICDSSKIPQTIATIKYLEFQTPEQIKTDVEVALEADKFIPINRPLLPDPGSPDPRIVALRHVIALSDALQNHLQNTDEFDQHAYLIYQFLLMLSGIIQDTQIDLVSNRPLLEVHIQHLLYGEPSLELQIAQTEKIISRAEQIISETRV